MPSEQKSTQYKDVGIDIKQIKKIQNQIGKNIEKTHSYIDIGKVLSGFGHYAGLIDIGNEVVALHTDGVGTKLLVAQIMEKYDTIGIDCIAMNVNDVICVGAKPLGYLSYIGLQKTNELLLKEITKGLVKGAKMAHIAIVGGETAIMPEIISGKTKDFNFDLAGMIFGIIHDKKKIILGDKIESDDVILGINSSGLHSNGYTLARKILLEKYWITDKPEFLDTSIGKELLKPTIIYSKPIIELLEELETNSIHGLSHITGGGFTKLSRLNPNVDYILDDMPKVDGIFKQIMWDGKIDLPEMYRTFNMGIGFCIIVQKDQANNIINLLNKDKYKCQIIGKIKGNGNGNVVVKTEDTLIRI